ncbi:SGNH/GDSL hydrolase family protein [Persephonella sp.]|uniref:SGNH/GDSL hydrolase family protein n=1 Tax=Persephonella sp. TaxID=2060922 RepID=UPI002635ED49|nr:SGNH/GDSL hydrolase family protein [Persephonella sp.]
MNIKIIELAFVLFFGFFVISCAQKSSVEKDKKPYTPDKTVIQTEEIKHKLENKPSKAVKLKPVFYRPKKLSILFVGDSMVEAIKNPSKKLCIQKGIKCAYVFKRGLRTEKWTEDELYKENLLFSLHIHKPDIVVISTGTNDIYNKESNEKIYIELVQLINFIKKVSRHYHKQPQIVLVAPPIPNDNNLNEYLVRKFSSRNIKLILSKYYDFSLWDGVHPDIKSSEIWAKIILKKAIPSVDAK